MNSLGVGYFKGARYAEGIVVTATFDFLWGGTAPASYWLRPYQ